MIGNSNYGVLLDMDGVIYRGGRLITGASELVAGLQSSGVPFLFVTNNSQRTGIDIAAKLRRMGVFVAAGQIYTCAMSTARFLALRAPSATAYVLGESGLTTALNEVGIAVVDKDPDYVIVGEGRTYTFEMLEHATNAIHGGARLIATNMDPSCPTADGTRPGCGAIVRLLEEATGRKAFNLGKPSPFMMREARKLLGIDAHHTVMVGDTMETDILGGLQLGYHTVLVLSGGTRESDLSQFAYRPSRVVQSVAELSPEWFVRTIEQECIHATARVAAERDALHESTGGGAVVPRDGFDPLARLRPKLALTSGAKPSTNARPLEQSAPSRMGTTNDLGLL